MELNLTHQAAGYRQQHKRTSIWKKITMVLASVVVFCTTYALILPAITMEQDTVCGMEEHIHEESCYTAAPSVAVTELFCNRDTLALHSHDESCLDENDLPACGYADYVLHRHDAVCYDADGLLQCALPEIDAHTHGEGCWQPPHTHMETCYTAIQGELLCPEIEGIPHAHGETCYTPRQNLICTLPEVVGHAHSESCKTVTTTLVCELTEEEAHAHDETCLDENGTLACTKAETTGHAHDGVCYESAEAMTCTLPEQAGHSHGEGCYETVSDLICQLSDTEPHVHVDACYLWMPQLTCEELTAEEGAQPALICRLDEIAAHTHDETCFTDEVLTCGKTEVLAHIHQADDCYQVTIQDSQQQVLSCGQEEHTHVETCYPAQEETDGDLSDGDSLTDIRYCGIAAHSHVEACYGEDGTLMCTMTEHEHDWLCDLAPSDPTAVETQEEWEADLPELTGDMASDLIAVAESQLGYEENAANYIITEDNQLLYYSRYNHWWDETELYGDWNAKFVSFCLDYADIDFPLGEHPADWCEALWEANLTLPAGDSPIPGDLVFFDTGSDGSADRVGIITAVSEAEGEFDAILERRGMVQKVTYDLDDSDIVEVARIPGNEPATAEVMDISSERVDHVIHLIDIMPSAEEFDENLSLYEANDDWDGYESYYKQVYRQALNAYVMYEDLSEPLREQVSNADKLLELQWLWSAQTFGITQGIDVYQINDYPDGSTTADASATVLFKGGSPDYYGVSMSFTWWSAIVVEANENGMLSVSQVITGEKDKSAYGPETENGFVLFIWSGNLSFDQVSASVHVGDIVSVPFDYTQTAAYTGTSYGTITFASGNFKADKDNASKLEIVEGADTNDLIEVNLYDYGVNINDPYNTDNKYPGFQQDEGTTTASLSAYGMNFGNNITSDFDAGNKSVTVKDGTTINATVDYNGTGYANSPVSGAIYPTLVNGYPALADGTSLQYLFHENSGYTVKKNRSSINGLFQRNALSGAYAFNSRENHAQFNADNDTFTLYKQIISSNFIMYPFGNFLPFNDIVHLSAQTSTIDRAYLQSIASSALYKYNAGYGDEYQILATELTDFIELMDDKHGTGWGAADAMNEYFSAAGLPPTFSQSDALLDKIYSIDFDEPTDFYFGMEMKMNFMMPKNGLTGNDNGNNTSDSWAVDSDGTYYLEGSPDGIPDYPMVFNFAGDDDVWVYIDGVLFLDLSGIHRHVGGRINFKSGTVEYFVLDPATGDVAATPYKTVKFADILGSSANLNANGTFKDYTQHTFNFYYMERGAGSGVYRMNFNFPLLRQNSISVAKELSVDEANKLETLGNPDFRFQVLQADASGNPTTVPFISKGVEYIIYSNTNTKIGTGTTGDNGVFTLKAGQRAEFTGIKENAGKYYVRELLDADAYNQYGTISVDGSSTTTSNNVTIGNDTFVGVSSPVKDASDGTTVFNFNNQVVFKKLGSLEISKILTTYPQTRTIPTFDFHVTLDGVPLAVGTAYTVGDENKTVETEGIVTVPAGSTAKIPNILAGTKFVVRETAESAYGHTVLYTGSEGVASDGTCATGTIVTESTVSVTVTNSQGGITLELPLQKTVANPDGTNRDFTFQLVQVTDETGETDTANGTALDATITADTTGNGRFILNYLEKDITSFPATYYYRITEIGDLPGVQIDDTVYIVKVTIARREANMIEATWSVLTKGQGGETIESEMPNLPFTNTLVGSLTLSKQVVGTAPEGGFTFTITTEPKLSGSYPAEGVLSEVTFTDGVATVALNHGQSITINGIPIGTTWTITETNADGYVVAYKVNDGEAQTGAQSEGAIIVGSTEVVYTNSAMYELPETGGGGMAKILTCGGLLAIMPCLWLLRRQRYRGRRVTGG